MPRALEVVERAKVVEERAVGEAAKVMGAVALAVEVRLVEVRARMREGARVRAESKARVMVEARAKAKVEARVRAAGAKGQKAKVVAADTVVEVGARVAETATVAGVGAKVSR